MVEDVYEGDGWTTRTHQPSQLTHQPGQLTQQPSQLTYQPTQLTQEQLTAGITQLPLAFFP